MPYTRGPSHKTHIAFSGSDDAQRSIFHGYLQSYRALPRAVVSFPNRYLTGLATVGDTAVDESSRDFGVPHVLQCRDLHTWIMVGTVTRHSHTSMKELSDDRYTRHEPFSAG